MNRDGDVRVQFRYSGSSRFGARLADILGLQEELGGEVRDGNGSGVVDGKGLDTSESNVLGWILNG